MRIACLGGGPAGLYFAILAKRADPSRTVEVFDRRRLGDGAGWGIVFSDRGLETLRAADAPSHAAITANFVRWEAIDIHHRGATVAAHGHGFAGISRARLTGLLQVRAEELGVTVHRGVEFADDAPWRDHDLVAGADGAHSVVRARHAEVFRPETRESANRYIWLGSTRRFSAFTFAFRETEWGWFTLHAYPFDAAASSCIVEAPEAAWRAAGLDRAGHDISVAWCTRLFADVLDGRPLAGGHAPGWQRFASLLCRRWWHGRTVLLGDAAHTVHFSIGSGTRLAMEDTIALARALDGVDAGDDVAGALARYEAERAPVVAQVRDTGLRRMEWFENVATHAPLAPQPFAYALLAGSGRLDREALRRRDPSLVAAAEAAGDPALPHSSAAGR